MSSAIVIEKLTVDSASLPGRPANYSSHQFQFIDPVELETAVQQVRRDLNMTRTERREPPHTRDTSFPAAEQSGDDLKFVRHYATPRRNVLRKGGRETQGQLPRLLDFESESNLVLEKLRNILLETPPVSKTPQNVKFTRKTQNIKTASVPRSSVARNDELDWLGPASCTRKTERVIYTAFQSQEDDISSPRMTSPRASSASSRTSGENLLFKTIHDTLKKIDDEESLIARRLANISFTSSSEASRESSVMEQGPVFPDVTVYRRPLRTTRDETCQTADELYEDNRSIQSEPDLPSAAESLLEQLEKEGFYEALLQRELDLIP